ncbi:hypothetical protein SAMN05216359_1276 [Roseateles sp. YR242]|nr:hypothetical protein SAMN05216359_1276 [Roseateles sp. YR242]
MCFDAATVDVGFKNKGFPHAVVLKRHDNSVMRSVLYATEDIHAAAFRLLSESAEEQAPRSEATAT